MNFPDKAVEIAARAIHEKGDNWDLDRTRWGDLTDVGRDACRQDARVALEASANIIAAHALRDAAGAMHNEASLRSTDRAGAMRDVAHWLRARADKAEDAP